MREAQEVRNRREMMGPRQDYFRPEGQRPRIDEHGNLPEVFLDEIPGMLRSHP
jgi:hypothetical protein